MYCSEWLDWYVLYDKDTVSQIHSIRHKCSGLLARDPGGELVSGDLRLHVAIILPNLNPPLFDHFDFGAKWPILVITNFSGYTVHSYKPGCPQQ